MTTSLSVLQDARIATPCSASWDDMKGDERVRFCEQCSLHVYDIDKLTTPQAERLIRETEGRLCGRLYRRADGRIMTRDCPIGLKVRRKVAGWVRSLGAVVLFVGGMFGLFRNVMGETANTASIAQLEPFATLQRWLAPPGPTNVGTIMGEICVRPLAPNPPANQAN